MSKRGETAVIDYLSNLITRGFNLARKVEAQNMRIGWALGHEYSESVAEDMANTGKIENEMVRLEALIDLLILVSNQATANANELLGVEG